MKKKSINLWNELSSNCLMSKRQSTGFFPLFSLLFIINFLLKPAAVTAPGAVTVWEATGGWHFKGRRDLSYTLKSRVSASADSSSDFSCKYMDKYPIICIWQTGMSVWIETCSCVLISDSVFKDCLLPQGVGIQEERCVSSQTLSENPWKFRWATSDRTGFHGHRR